MSKDFLYSPWRIKYILSEKEKKCIFCQCDRHSEDIDEESLVVYKGLYAYVIMNLYPYNNGHIMVVPYKHLSSLSDLSKDEMICLFELVQTSEQIIKNVFSTDGINVGINLGKAAGAGIDEHLHIHLVPRWFGDSNFMTSISETRVIPEDFIQSRDKLRKAFKDYYEQ